MTGCICHWKVADTPFHIQGWQGVSATEKLQIHPFISKGTNCLYVDDRDDPALIDMKDRDDPAMPWRTGEIRALSGGTGMIRHHRVWPRCMVRHCQKGSGRSNIAVCDRGWSGNVRKDREDPALSWVIEKIPHYRVLPGWSGAALKARMIRHWDFDLYTF